MNNLTNICVIINRVFDYADRTNHKQHTSSIVFEVCVKYLSLSEI